MSETKYITCPSHWFYSLLPIQEIVIVAGKRNHAELMFNWFNYISYPRFWIRSIISLLLKAFQTVNIFSIKEFLDNSCWCRRKILLYFSHSQIKIEVAKHYSQFFSLHSPRSQWWLARSWPCQLVYSSSW